MVERDRKKFVTAFSGLCLVFDRAPLPALIEVYFRALSRFDIEDVVSGIGKAITTCKFWPKPAEIIEAISGNAPTLELWSEHQWGVVMDAIRNLGSYSAPHFDDEITRYLIGRRFAWKSLCAQTEKELVWTRKEFISAYEAASTAEYQPQIAAPENVRLLLEGIGQ